MRSKGEGTLSKRANGSWCAAYVDGRGKRRFVYAPTQREAAFKLKRGLLRREEHRPITPARLTLAQYLTGWLENTAKGRLRRGTFRDYESLIRVHVLPSLGKQPVAQLTGAEVRTLISEKLASGLSARRVQLIHAVLRSALNDGVAEGPLTTNPAILRRAIKVEKRRPTAMSPEEAKSILAACEGSRLQALVYMAMSTGLRQGELLGLQWDDLDLGRGTIQVWHQLQGNALVPLKTSSEREQRISADLVAMLRAHRLTQQPISPFVFASARGTALNGVSVTHRIQSLLRSRGLPAIRFHDLRHAAATLHLRMGASMREVMELLGHSRIGVTMDTYAAVLPDAQRESAERVAAALSR